MAVIELETELRKKLAASRASIGFAPHHRMLDACAAAGLPAPSIEEAHGGVALTFRKLAKSEPPRASDMPGEGQATAQVTAQDQQVGEQVGEQVRLMLAACRVGPKSKAEILEAAGLARAYLNYKRHLQPLLECALIERTIPDKPTSRLQKYRLTAKGRALLERKDP